MTGCVLYPELLVDGLATLATLYTESGCTVLVANIKKISIRYVVVMPNT